MAWIYDTNAQRPMQLSRRSIYLVGGLVLMPTYLRSGVRQHSLCGNTNANNHPKVEVKIVFYV